jgi:hypothetical protein
MPHHLAAHQSQQNYELFNVNPNDLPRNSPDCKLPIDKRPSPSKSERYVPLFVLLIYTIIQIIIVIFMILTVIAGNETNGLEFPYYKNSRFKECTNRTLNPDACAAYQVYMNGSTAEALLRNDGMSVLEHRLYRSKASQVEYSWCDVASCFNGFKVIPSSPQSPVIRHTLFGTWTAINMTGLGVLWSVVKRNSLYKNRKACRGLGELVFLDWIVTIYTFGGPFLLWWINFIRFARNPEHQSMALTLTAWLNVWVFSFDIRFHPFSCSLPRWPKLKSYLPRGLTLLSLLQALATIFVLRYRVSTLTHPVIHHTAYVCLESQIAAGPGTSTCSSVELCRRNTTVDVHKIHDGFSVAAEVLMYIMVCVLLVAAIFGPVFIWLLAKFADISFVGKSTSIPASILARMAIVTAYLFLMSIFGFMGLAKSRGVDFRMSSVIIDWNCHAVHVQLSPWGSYLDVDAFAQAYRFVRILFLA